MNENDLTGILKGMLIFIEGHIALEIPDKGSFDPYGIILKHSKDGVQMTFLETMGDSDVTLKGMPGQQMTRRIEDMIRQYRHDYSVLGAALVMDACLRPQEGGEGKDAVVAWLDDRGTQRVRVIIEYNLSGSNFKITSKTIEPRDELFLPSK